MASTVHPRPPTTLAFLGDLMLGRKVSHALRQRPPEYFWGDTLPTLRAADAVFANLECPLAEGDLRRNAWKTFHFRGAHAAVEILKAGNVRCVCLANNHMLDFGAPGLEQTLRTLDAAHIAHAGAGADRTAAEAGALVETAHLKIGFLAATDNVRAFGAGPGKPGTNFRTTIFGRARTLEWIAGSAAALRERGADLIVLSMHWGPNMRVKPPVWFRSFARAAIGAGADVIHGHSAHVFQGIERCGNGIVFYDTGNFIDDYWKFPFRETYWTFIHLLDVNADRTWRIRLIPVSLGMPPRIARDETFHAICARMKAMCRPFNTPIVETAEGLEIEGARLRAPCGLAA